MNSRKLFIAILDCGRWITDWLRESVTFDCEFLMTGLRYYLESAIFNPQSAMKKTSRFGLSARSLRNSELNCRVGFPVGLFSSFYRGAIRRKLPRADCEKASLPI